MASICLLVSLGALWRATALQSHQSQGISTDLNWPSDAPTEVGCYKVVNSLEECPSPYTHITHEDDCKAAGGVFNNGPLYGNSPIEFGRILDTWDTPIGCLMSGSQTFQVYFNTGETYPDAEDKHGHTLRVCKKDGIGATCTVVEDPHIKGFDGGQISLLAMKGSAVGKASNDKWLVKSGSVRIQARYMADRMVKDNNEFVRAVAVGGPFLMGNIITVGSLEDRITWNGRPILTNGSAEPSRFDLNDGNLSVSIARTKHSKNVANPKEENPGIEIKVPLGVSLIVNRLHRHLNVAITMPPQKDGQDGLCGNFNGFVSDDSLELSRKRFDPNVPHTESFFAGLDFA